MQRSAFCRSRRELSNAYLLAKFGFDTAENEPFQVCPLSASPDPPGVGNGASVKSVDGTSYRWGDQVPGYHEIDRPTTDVIKAEPGLSRRRAAG